MLFNAYPDCVVSSSLIYSDWPEYTELSFIRRMLRKGDSIIDVGANVGHISLLLADIVGGQNVFAFEPAPRAFHRLEENWQLNDLSTERLFQVAVGASEGEVFIDDDDHPTTTLRVSDSPSGNRAVPVPLVSLDDYRYLWAGRPVGLLKVDVEGYEHDVFQGCSALLREDRPRLIMFESLSGRLDARLATSFAEHNYAVFQLDERGAPDFVHCSEQNLFAVPKEVMANRFSR
jgi:FkbM family methyltransferase